MKYVVVDTDVFSRLLQGTDIDGYQAHLSGTIPTLSFTTVAEVYFGASKAGWGERKVAALEEAIRRYLVAPYDTEMARLWGKLKSQAQSLGHPLGQVNQNNDLWIAATSIYYDAPLLTGNGRHFRNFPGLSLIT
ncbi:VapC toxin family PIN domain ribonuclease [Streptomyces tateyamensis]|uniref:VapC toxin family PIN domain ribonuclease n=1 Tax=Streptomyces tateyamensis TaxID=565073 RepID=A0A2V4N7S7_9ACTN|nr:type II toxin-antitoxin system VapC family toxin [Streptomyces tateyamensis]PYC80496.1 VapC toxin family PIN domain ribonuclease [Streptomyces tateyamensis]